ncbi:TetR/AcrR family transcriptional regulator [Rufibacter sp. XAAS-G3-1]|uniref:TetR/AcrR family transcriptional regulator n=1 Tax=Rufibacter sp. XAAS-G3-1 TaxID=2729134 RepID=UPI002104FB71|nr:TetR/AcrR family transcriptional regulator [Rufibacter sp. XAAS-G3-1]
MSSTPMSRKEQIDQVATSLFKSRGFAATTMRDLALELGIEAGSLYSHIKSKEDILQRVCFKMADEFNAAFNEVKNQDVPAGEKLRLAVAAHVRVLTKNPQAAGVFLNEWRHLSEPSLSKFHDMRFQYEESLREIVREGIANGEFKVTDEKFVVLTLLSSLNWLHMWYKPEGKMSPDEIAEFLSNLLLNGLKNF